MGKRSGPGVPGPRPEVPTVRGAAVAAAPTREREGESREGKAGVVVVGQVSLCVV